MKTFLKGLLAYSTIFLIILFILAIDSLVNKFGTTLLLIFVPMVALGASLLISIIKKDEWYKIADPWDILDLKKKVEEEPYE